MAEMTLEQRRAIAMASARARAAATAQSSPEPTGYGGRPEEEGLAQAMQIGAKPLNQSLNDAARSFANTSTFGLADELAGRVGPNTVPQEQAITAEARQRNPLVSNMAGGAGLLASPANKPIGYVAGKVLPVIGTGLKGIAQRYGNYGLQGGLLNTLYQATLGEPEKAKEGAAATAGIGAAGMVAPEGGAGEAAMTAAKNFGKGAVLGVAAPAAVEIASPVLRTVFSPILARIHPEEAALAGIGKALDRGNLTPDMLAAKDAKRGPAAMLANAAQSVNDYARDIAQFPGRARSMAQAGFGAQTGGKMATTGGAVGRVEGAINNSLTDETAKATTDALIELRTKSSSPLWQDMMATPRAAESPVLDILATNPEIKKGLRIGMNTSRNAANAAGEEFDPSRFAIDGKPTLEAWHGAKEGLDDILFSGGKHIVDPLTGKLTKYGRSVNDMRQSVLEELKLQFPEYTDALQSWSGPTQAMRMVDLGAKAARGDARVTRDLMKELTENERDFARIGYADQAKYLASKTKDGANVVKSLFGDQNARRNAEAFFPTRAEFNEFRRSLAIESGFHADRANVLGGSPTASRTLGAEDVAQEIGKATIEGGTRGGATGAAAGAIGKGLNYLKAEPEVVRDAAGKMLFTTDPAEKARVIEELRKLNAKGSIYGSPGKAMLSRGGVMGSKMFGF